MTLPKSKYVPVAILIAILLVLAVAYFAFFSSNATVPTVVKGDTIGVYYTGTLTNGTVFGSNVGQQPLQFTVGSGQVIPGFDQGVIGMKLNQTRNLTIPANAAYGPINPALIIKAPLSQFKNRNVTVGMPVTETQSNGQQAQGTVIAVNSTTATINFNSPLAGQTLIFSIKVVKIQQNSTA